MHFFFVIACALKQDPLPGASLLFQPVDQRIDWDAAGKEAANALSEYIQVDTVNPPGNELLGAQFLSRRLAVEGIEAEIDEFEPGRANLIARVKGNGSQKPLCLLSHIDVVTFETENWIPGRHPLSGHIDQEGSVWGRGALDMKGMGVLEMMTLIWLKRLNIPLNRDVILLAVADEEVGGKGIKALIERQWDRIGCSHVINEGGLGLKGLVFPDIVSHAISVGEKGNVWLKMIANGEAGHGSISRPDEAPKRLVDAIQTLQNIETQISFSESMQLYLAAIGKAKGGVEGFVLQRPTLVRWLLLPSLMREPLTRAALSNTIHLTGLSGSHKPNVVPSEAFAYLDCRLLPGVDPIQFVSKLQSAVESHIRFEVISAKAGNVSTRDDPLYRAIKRHAPGDDPKAAVGPVISVGFTDSIYLRKIGVRAYGYVPFVVDEAGFRGFHGANEKIETSKLQQGLKTLLKIVLEVSGTSSPPQDETTL